MILLKKIAKLLVCGVVSLVPSVLTQGASFQLEEFDSGHTHDLNPFNDYDCAHVDFFIENDGGIIKLNNPSDKHYTSGVMINYAYHPQWAKNITNILQEYVPYENTEQNPVRSAAGFSVGQQIFTPNNIEIVALQPNDRPYAGWLYGSVFYQRANSKHFDHFQLDVGVVGPSALTAQTQSLIHTLFQIQEPKGWDNQLHDEFGFNFKYNHKWKFNIVGHPFEDRFRAQLIPSVGMTLGNMNRDISAGALVRVGYNPPNDFGPGRIDDLPSYTHTTYRADRAKWELYNAYVFAGLQGSFVEHDTFIQGNNYHDSHSKRLEHYVTRFHFGISLQIQRFQITYSETFISEQFADQDSYDSYATFMIRWHMDF